MKPFTPHKLPIAQLKWEPLIPLMGQQGLTRKDMEPMVGSRARMSEVMAGKRPLTLEMIRRSSVELRISANVLIGAGSREAQNPQSHK